MNAAWKPYVGIHPYPQSTLGMVGQIKVTVRGETLTSPQYVITQELIDTPVGETEEIKLIAYRILPPKGMQVLRAILVALREKMDA